MQGISSCTHRLGVLRHRQTLLSLDPAARVGRSPNPRIALSTLQQGLIASDIEDAKAIWAETLTGRRQESKDTASQLRLLEKSEITSWEFLTHLTISRDKTGNSNYAKEQLIALAADSIASGDKKNKTSLNEAARDNPTAWDRIKLLDILDDFVEPTGQTSQSWSYQIIHPSGFHSESSDEEFALSTIIRDLIDKTANPGSGDSTTDAYSSDSSSISDQEDVTMKPDEQHLVRSAKEAMDQGLEPDDSGAGENDETRLMYKVLQQMESLKAENRRLKHQLSQMQNPASKSERQLATTSQVFHRLSPSEVSLYSPTWMVAEKQDESLLRLDVVLGNLGSYLSKHPEIAFAVFKDYRKKNMHTSRNNQDEDTVPPIEPYQVSMKFISDEMVDAFKAFMAIAPNFSTLFPNFKVDAEIQAPFLFWYHYRSSYLTIACQLKAAHRDLMDLMTRWIEETYSQEYDAIEASFGKGYVSSKTIKYLIRPGDVLVSKSENGVKTGILSTTWLQDHLDAKDETPTADKKEANGEHAVTSRYFSQGWHWAYDGTLYKQKRTIAINLTHKTPDEEVDVSQLEYYPLKYASQDDRNCLRRRGETFRRLGTQRLVEYHTRSWSTLSSDIERYMVDYATYKMLHHGKDAFNPQKEREPGLREFSADEASQGDEVYLFPPKVNGYSLVRKSWVDLYVDNIYEVQWDKTAFDNLVIDRDTKELIQALVMNQLEAERGTDIISGKGNGLIILLHGGPGTGKTFTAEAVAEIAEKPLYRVTCGDIGTKPEQAEKYLESVLHLGKSWGCVVLLDEADVFLEERSLSQLERNALVSVFLRVLEYYEGILILTSNRVGTFDEAFKSRIQLALHYKNLSDNQRRRIWWNFLNRLRNMEKGEKPTIDIDDLLDRVDELASDNVMNGRQIRNVITTARQLAKHRGKIMTFSDLRHVIEVTGRFDKYLQDVREGLTDDELARTSGKR
ncbi:hypothetical protein CFD26_101608 [Aspergillus turcosus]|uniref:AAA+ ATPase domain-containing protein n=1 Tax=Aspergillus turcosus TaxID=1245748 RepID=A0A421CTI8_9EURO|nr:hypothetical protein CFD26_101608 [Aspergillus turcosus]